ncbi:MAG TPA: hypothetical protein VHC70_09965 [Phycisphaerales bacterium]|jgi:hypothetical protein|nr:hypothetical protein [Phycisphaerales bacterium]
MNTTTRRFLWAAWAIVPVAAFALHMGMGKNLLARDRAGSHLKAALAAEEAEDYATAAEEYAAAKNALPELAVAERARLAVAEARARVYTDGLVEAGDQLQSLIEQLSTPALRGDMTEDEARTLTTKARDALGTAAYFTAWQMRLEGAAPDEWKPETELARQQFRLLAETAAASGDKELADSATKNDEQVIRLERMDLSELQGLPFPKKCCKCNCCCQKKRSQRLSKSPPKDARQQIKSDSAAQARNRDKGS